MGNSCKCCLTFKNKKKIKKNEKSVMCVLNPDCKHIILYVYNCYNNNIYIYRYIVDSGKFEISKEGQGKLAECFKGSTFGELALIYNACRAATVTCIEDAKLWALDRNSFRFFT